jgi:hypothetical protein
MVHQWKLTKTEGLKLIHKTIRESLIESNHILDMNELVSKINEKTKTNHIHHIRKYNRLSKYIKCEYGGMIKFLDSHSIYGISHRKNRIMVHLLNDTDHTTVPKNIIGDDEWIFI